MHQDSDLSPLLFGIVMEVISREFQVGIQISESESAVSISCDRYEVSASR